MNGHPQPNVRAQTLSPISITGSEWSGMASYDPIPRTGSPYSPTLPYNRGDPATRPDSGPFMNLPSNNQFNGGYNAGPLPLAMAQGGRRPSDPPSRNSSPAVSIANSRSSDGTISDQQSRKYRRMEYELSQHYAVLRAYLRGGAPQPPRPNKARDKLLRLSPVQFHELSTDVFDELQRRQAMTPLPGRLPRRENVPPFLQPRPDFHEKRNQARQKLSSLQTSRFRDLSTDVFCELERRFPHFADGGRKESPRSSSRGPSNRTQTPSGGPGVPPQNGFVPPPRTVSQAASVQHGKVGQQPQARKGSMAAASGVPQFDNPPSLADNDFGRPMQKQFQSNTITPNKSVMVEDEDEAGGVEPRYERTSEVFGLETAVRSSKSNRDTTTTSRSATSMNRDQKVPESVQLQLTALQEKVDSLGASVKLKDEEIRELQLQAVSNAKHDWTRLKQDMERKLEDAESLNRSLKEELDRQRSHQATVEGELRSQLDTVRKQSVGDQAWRTKYELLQQEYQGLQGRLEQQQQITEEVREQATKFLNEMRTMAEGSSRSWEREEKLHNDVQRLEEEVKEWKARYAKSKAQLRNVRASSLGLSIARADAARFAKDDAFRRADGLVKDIHITKFQIAIDELLRIARTGEPAAVLDYVKFVVIAVRSIANDIDSSSAEKDGEVAKRRAKLKSRISTTANNVITACKNFAYANGVSPVSLLDAAASHLTAAVVELVRTVKIRPTPPEELEGDDDGTLEPLHNSGYFNVTDSYRRRSAQESVYSAISTPPPDALPQTSHGASPHSRPESRRLSIPNAARRGAASGSIIRDEEIELENLKVFIEDQTDSLVQSIQALVASIRADDKMPIIRSHISSIADVVSDVVSATEESCEDSSFFAPALRERALPIAKILTDCKTKLLAASVDSQALDNGGKASTKEFAQRLPPLAFEIARETKELVQRIEGIEARREGTDELRYPNMPE